ncbi:MAG TPA: type II toxin-antitoxin system HigB family toxin, partial [Bacteroidetes bacterium]|nr:type II toxin-antitoxin system HigB family toxin [Bacteroidota bacterium]
MKLVNRPMLINFGTRHSEIKSRLDAWAQIVINAEWENPHDVREIFGSADFLGSGRVIF